MIRTHANQVYDLHTKVIDGRNLLQAQLHCGSCQRTEPLNIRPDMPPSEVLRKFRQKNWRTDDSDRRRCLCPDCKHIRKPTKPDPILKGPSMNKALHQPETIIPTPEMPMVRKIFGIIDGHFDEEKGCYLGDWSDKKVADLIGVGYAVVAKVREDSGLKIKGNPALIALRNDFETWRSMGQEINDRLTKLEQQL